MRKVFLLFIATLFLFSCSSEKKKPVPEEARLAQEAFRIAEKVKDAYLVKNNSLIQRLTTRNGYLRIISSVKDFDVAILSFTPKWVDIEGNELYLYIDWTGTWQVGTKSYTEKGLAAFKFRLNPLKLDDILRNNPFSFPK
ncbi:MAG: hypothetical protein GXO99_08925 [Nitrospirae bacterium]|nr:hypothetical protein [Nitrospirota bacterium]